MNDHEIRPLPVLERHESFVLLDDLDGLDDAPMDGAPFIDESVVRQMILDGEPDDLPATGNPSMPQPLGRQVPNHPVAFAS